MGWPLMEGTHPFEGHLINLHLGEQFRPEYLKLNPAGRIPTLVHGDLVLFESPAICVYICELDAASQFIPPLGHPNRPLFFQWLAYLVCLLLVEALLCADEILRWESRHRLHLKRLESQRPC